MSIIGGYVDIDAIESASISSSGSTALVARSGSTLSHFDGQGGSYFGSSGGYVGYVTNGKSVVSDNTTSGQWLVTEPYGPPVSVLAFGADPTASTDSTAAFTNALATSRSVFVPCGTYTLSATISVTAPGQLLYGPHPENPSDIGDDGGTTLRFSSSETLSACIVVGGGASSPEWAGVRNLGLFCSDVALPSSGPGTSSAAIVVNGGSHVTLDTLYIEYAVNGVQVNSSSDTHIRRVVTLGIRGVYDFYLTGANGVTLLDLNASGDVVRLPTISSAAINTSTLHLAASAGVGVDQTFFSSLVEGMMVGASYSLQAGTTVTSVDATNGTVTISQPLNSVISSGVTLSFGQIGLWIDSNCSRVQGAFIRHKSNSTGVFITNTLNGGSPPSDIQLRNIEGDFLASDFFVNFAGQSVTLVTPTLYGGLDSGTSGLLAAGGRGVYFGPSATDMTIIGARIAAQLYTGIEVAGGGFHIAGSYVAQNGTGSSGTPKGIYDGIHISSGASHVRIIGNQIGVLDKSGGDQRYGIYNEGSVASAVIVDGNDLRGNASGPVNTTSNMTFGSNLGVAGGGYSTTLSSNSLAVQPTDSYVGITHTASSPLAIYLPTSGSATPNQVVQIKDEGGTAGGAGTYFVIVAPSGTTIDGASSQTISSGYGSLALRWNNSNKWLTI